MAERDYLEQNIERLFHSVEPELKVPAPDRDRIRKVLIDEGTNLGRAAAHASPQKIAFGKWVVLAAAVVVLLVVLFAVVMLRESPKEPEEPITQDVEVTEKVDDDSLAPKEEKTSTDKTSVPDENLEAEMKRVLDMGIAGDIPGLIAVLARGHFLSKVVAANYLGRIGDAGAIGPLEKAGADWVGDETENPFSIAIEQIRKRLGLSDEDKDDKDQDLIPSDEGDPNLVEKDDSPDQVLVETTAIEGYVYDESSSPQSGLTLYCGNLADYITSRGGGLELVETAVTAEDGFYQFEGLDDGLYIVRRSDENVSGGVMRRAVLAMPNKTRRLDFGTGRILSGWARLDGQLLPNTRLLLADPYEPYTTAFACYTVTDGQGNYAFTSAPTGLYGVYIESADAWIKLGKVSVGPADVTNYNFDIEYVTVRAEINSADPNQLPDIVDVYVEQEQAGERLRIADAVWPTETGQPYIIERLFAGSYNVVVVITGGVGITETIELPVGQAEINVKVTVPPLTSSVSGLLAGIYSDGFVLHSTDNKIMAAIEPDNDGMYFIEPLPAGQYVVEYLPLGKMASLADFSLEDDENQVVDIDTDQWADEPKAFVYVYVVDSSGVPVIGAAANLQGSGLPDKEVTSRGALFVVEPGSYVVQAEYPEAGYKQASVKVELESGDLTQFYNRTQVVYVALETK